MNRLTELSILIPHIRVQIRTKSKLLLYEQPLHNSNVVTELVALTDILIAYKVEYVKLMNQPKTKLDGTDIGITSEA